MTNHNGIWYESGRTARYGGECNGDLATTLERCFRLDAIKLTERLQLSYNDGCLDLKPGDDDTTEPCIELENNNWTDLAPKVQLIEIVQLNMSRCGLDGAFSSTRAELHDRRASKLTLLHRGYPCRAGAVGKVDAPRCVGQYVDRCALSTRSERLNEE